MKHLLSIVSILVLLAGITSAQTVTSISPLLGSDDVSATSNITVNFSEAMDNATITSSTVIISGSQRGIYSGSFSYGATSATFDPDSSFFAGEIITVVVTNGVQDSGGDPITSPYRTTFTVEASGNAEFQARENYTADGSNFTDWTITADLNEDGYVDIVTLVPSLNRMSVFTNDGDGSFTVPTNYTTANSFQVEAKDVNNDGAIDLVTSNNNAFMMSVFINNGSGSGTFASKVDYANSQSWNGKGLTTGDIDNDGDEDVLIDVIIGGAVDSIQVFTNDGDGTFTIGGGVSTTGSFDQIKMWDIDGDEDLDLIGVSSGLGQFWSWKNDGSGNFSANTTTNVTTSTLLFALANFNGNGPIDAITSDQADDQYTIISENPSFLTAFGATPSSVGAGDGPTGIAPGDLDGDGDIDVVISNALDQNLSILINDGSASFTESNYTTTGSYANYISLADIDNDGDLDIVTGNQDGTVSVIKNYPGGNIVSVSPSHGELDVAASTNIAIKFDEQMDSGTLNATTVKVFGSLTGLHGGSYTYTSGDSTLTIDPTVDFVTGEVVTVVVSTGVESSIGTPLESGSSTNFIIATGDGEIFGSATNFTAGNETNALVSADVNGDGESDLVVVNTSADSIAVLIGAGDGSFASPANYYAGDAPSDVAVGDLDSDGDLDLIVSTTTDNVLSRFLNNGDGTFAARATYSSTSSPGSISLGDIDNDGDLDVYYSANGVMYTQFNSGSGVFSSESVWGTGSNIVSSPVDLNGDGLTDYLGVSSSLNVVLNDGDGTYSYNSSSFSGFSSTGNGLTKGDFDGDGDIDVVASYNVNSGDGYIAYFANNGSGSFGSATSYALTNNTDTPAELTAFDIDGDGDLDVAVVNTDFDHVVVFLNDGTGVFTNDGTYSTGDSPKDVSSADYNGDGIMDLAIANSVDDNISVLLGGLALEISSVTPSENDINASASSNINITFNQSVQSGTITSSSVTAVGSVSGTVAGAVSYDGGSNTATLNPSIDFIIGETVTVFVTSDVSTSTGANLSSPYQYSFTVETTGGEIFRSPTDIDFTNNISDLKYIDFDNDGDADIVTAENGSAGGLGVYLNDGSGIFTFSDTTATPFTSINKIAIADFDQDGYMDVVGSNNSMGGKFINVYINDQAGSFNAPVNYAYSTNYAEGVAVGDINLDGYPDIVATRFNADAVHVLLNDGDGTFTAQSPVTVGGGPYFRVQLIDVDSDNDLDIVTSDWDDNTISVTKNNGDGTFASHSSYNMTGTGVYTGFFESGDIDGDGDLDIIATQTDDEDDPVEGLTIFLNDGTGNFSSTSSISKTARDIELMDMEGDGDLDLVLANGGIVTIITNDGSGNFTTLPYTSSAGSTFIYAIDASDMDGDGDLDLAAGSYSALHVFENGDLVNVSSTSPSVNGLDVSVSSNITVTFGTNMDVTTFQDSSVIVTGSSSGILARGLSLSNPTLTIDPTNNFIPGEKITVTLTNDLESSAGTALFQPYSFSFTVATAGNGSMAYQDSLVLTNSVFRMINVDVDSDGDEDLIGFTNSIIDVYELDAGSYSYLGQSTMPSGFERMYPADIDQDGDMDLAVHPVIGTNQIRFLENDGSGSFTVTDTLVVSSAPDGLVFEDFDGDGITDLAYIYGAQITIINWGLGNFEFSGTATFGGGSGYPTPSIIASGDVDNDGDIDIVVSGSDKVVIGLNGGSRSFDYENIYDVATDPEDIELGDFNGDGYLDIVVTSEEGAAYSIFINNQDGSFAEAVEYSTAPFWAGGVTPFDYDGDGDLDLGIYLEDDDSGEAQLLFAYNQSGTFSNQLGFEFPSAAPYFYNSMSDFSLVDIDGDSDLDLSTLIRTQGTQVFAFATNEAGSSVAPTVAASSVTFSAVSAYSAKVSWTNGDGARRMVLVKEGSAVDGSPVDDSGYNPNAEFGSGSEIGTGNFIVYGGASNSVVVSGLDPETEYHVQVFELNGIPGSEKFFTTGAPTGNFTSGPPPTIWSKNDSTLVFTKADNADWALEANQDRITDNLWITRKDEKGIFNILDEFEFDNDISPEGTMWALGTTDNLANLTFDTFRSTLGGSIGDNIEDADMVLYVEADDLYIDINFSSWTSGGEGGGFSYTRAKGPAPAVMTQTFQDSAGFAIRFDNENSYERYLEVYDDSFLLGSEFTIEAWVKLDSLGIEQGIMSLYNDMGFGVTSSNTVYAYHNQPEATSGEGGGEGEGDCCFKALTSNSNEQSSLTPVQTEFEGPTGTISLESSDVLVKDEWYHIALTGESGGFLKLYINGVIQDSDSVQNVGVDESYWYFGRERDRGAYLYGFMDEIRIWKDERTVSQIRSYMHRPYGGDIGRLYGYWQLNEGTGTSTFDGVSDREAEFDNGNSSAWFASDAPIGEATVEETTNFQTGTVNIGNAALDMGDGFDNPVDVQVTEVAGEPNQFPAGFTSGLGGKYFVINLFGDPGTFSANLTLNYGSGVITAAQQSNPSQLKLYKRASNSTGAWTEIASASSANSATGVVTWNGITAFSQFMAVADEPSFNIQITDGTNIVSYNDSTYTFESTLFDLEDGFADSLLTINSKSTLTGTLYLDQNSNGVYDSGTDSLLTADKELSYTPSGTVKLRYNSSTSGKETAVLKLQHSVGVDSVSLNFYTVEGDPVIAGNTGENGWYLLSNPFTTTIGDLLSSVWTQGAVNSDAPGGDATMYTFSEDSSKYVAITTDIDTTKLAAGQGLLVYLYADDDLGDGQDDIDGGWPKTFNNYGNPFGTDVSITAKNVNHDGVEGTTGSEGFALLGNPYGWSLSADSVISTLKREDALANSYVYRWNAVEKTYQILASGSINPYESVFVRVITSGTTANLSFDYDDGVGVLAKSKEPEMFDLNLVHLETERSSTFNLRNTKTAKTGIDPYDGYYLGSYANSYSNLYSIVGDQALSINNIPLGFDEEIEIPLYADATLDGDFVLNWDTETLPEEWTVTLENNSTGEIVAMNETSTYSFTMNSNKKSVPVFSNKIFTTENNLGKGKINNTPVLTLKVVSSLSVGTENDLGIPEVVELYQNYPNPFNPSSVIRFGVPTQSKVKLEVFDILGRRVATLLNNEIKPAGRYNVTFSANNLASGMYLYRLSVGNKVIVKKMTFIK